MTVKEVLDELKTYSEDNIKAILQKHGANEPVYGVKVENMKKIQKKVKKDYELSLALYDTGIYDAQYLAGLIADEGKMMKKDLEHWAKTAKSLAINEYTVAWIAAESRYGWELAGEWIDAGEESIATSGWNTISSLVAIKQDAELDKALLQGLVKRIEKEIHSAPNRVRYAMNGCLIAIGGYVPALADEALAAGKRIGKVTVYMGDTACKVPASAEYIQKMIDKGQAGKKKKMARC